MKTVVVQLNLVNISFIAMSLMLTGISDAKIDPETIVGICSLRSVVYFVNHAF